MSNEYVHRFDHSVFRFLTPHVRGKEKARRVGKREFHPQASHRTVRDSLPSYGSCHLIERQQYFFCQ
jgi:hypothetical protein